MNRKFDFRLLVLGYLLVAVYVLAVVSLVQADDGGSAMLPVDAKLGQYINEPAELDMASVDAKLAHFIQEPVDYSDPDELLAYRWQAMAEYYAAHDMLNFSYAQAAEHQAARWQAMAAYYEQHGLLNESAVVEEPADDVSIIQGAG